MEDILNQYLKIKNVNDKQPNEINLILGTIYEYSFVLRNVEKLNRGISISLKIQIDRFKRDEKMIYYYNLANAYGYHRQLTQKLNSIDFWNFENNDLIQETLNLRKALIFSKETQQSVLKCQILTNLGIVFSHIGRYTEAVEYWKEALMIDNDFGMAKGNLGFGLYHYAQILYDEGHKIYFLKEAYKYLDSAIKCEDVYLEAKKSFKSIHNQIESVLGLNFLNEKNSFKDYELGKTTEEIEYREWCLNNCLFINPLNDIIFHNIVAQDVLCLPTIIAKAKGNKILDYHSFYNQIKQEFVSSRYLYYDSIMHEESHFSDYDNKIINTLDYSAYSFNIEKTKIAFRILYSILDKIAYLLNSYLDLGLKPFEVSFKKIWGTAERLNPKIENTQNWGLRGLYWLSKDFSEGKNNEFYSLLDPEAQEFSTIRNFIEHKSFKLVESGKSGISSDKFIYVITRDDFQNKTLKLLKTIRASIIYVSLLINIEENKKMRPKKNMKMITLKSLDDSFKY